MQNTWFEELRYNLQSVEVLEKAIVSQMLALNDNPKDRAFAEHRINNFGLMIQQKASDVLTFLREEKTMKKNQLAIIQGQKSLKQSDKKKASDITWQNFYDKVKDIKEHFKKQKQTFPNNELKTENTVEYFRKIVFMAPFKEPEFSAEENRGKYVDMHSLYLDYLNICKVMTDGKEGVQMHDYLWFLQNFDKFEDFPPNRKFKHQHKYLTYLESLQAYLSSFLKRTQPLFDLDSFRTNIAKGFQQKLSQNRISGWDQNQQFYEELKSQYCPQCKKLFMTNQAYVGHLLGKKHKNAEKVFDVNPPSQEEIEESEKKARQNFIAQHQQRKRKLAWQEFRIVKLKEELASVVYDTMNLVRKKQTRGYEDNEDLGEESSSDEEEADAPVYNPKNLPLGWDGKPIPYWLYKLHGLGIEYKCQICGNYSYWGRRAFQMHFQEWRHNYGMKCLKIPNTVHFKDITTIADALALHEKLTRQSQQSQFRPDMEEEFQDNEGNVLNRKTYLDMKKQGLLD